MMTTTTATRAKGSTVVPRAARQRMLTAARLLLWEGCAGRRGTSLFAWTQLGQRVAAVPSCDPASPPRHVICCFCFVFFFCDCVSRVLERQCVKVYFVDVVGFVLSFALLVVLFLHTCFSSLCCLPSHHMTLQQRFKASKRTESKEEQARGRRSGREDFLFGT